MGVVFSILVAIVIAGFLWFYVARPILEDWGLIAPRAVNYYQVGDPSVMSLSESTTHAGAASSLQTDSRQTADKPPPAAPSRDVMLNTYRLLRKYGIPREEARPVLKAAGFPLDNNLWADAAPPEPARVTPIAGRPTRAEFQTDPEYPYEAPA